MTETRIVKGGYRGTGFVIHLVPLMNHQAVHITEMLRLLRSIKGFEGVTLASLAATVSYELKRLQPRLRRVAPGVYQPTQINKLGTPPSNSSIVQETLYES